MIITNRILNLSVYTAKRVGTLLKKKEPQKQSFCTFLTFSIHYGQNNNKMTF